MVASEIYFIGISLAVLLAYHAYYLAQYRRKPTSLSQGLANHLRRTWVEEMMKPENHTVSVQSLRNWIMASSFLASSAIVLSLGMLSVAFKLPHPTDILQNFGLFEMRSEFSWQFKWLALAADLFFAFFNFTLAIRHFNHVSFLIHLPNTEGKEENLKLVLKSINDGFLHNSFGMRCYYFTIPLVLWLFSPMFLLVGSVLLIGALYVLDHNI